MVLKRFVKHKMQNAIVRLGVQLQKYNSRIARLSLPKFANEPEDLVIELPRRIIHPENIYIGDHVSLGPGSFLRAAKIYPSPTMQNPDKPVPVQSFDAKIVIGNRVTSTADLQIAAQETIIIEDDVMFASNIHINDGSHGYYRTDLPYKYQKLVNIRPIRIKRGSWIGQNVMILSGVTIGELSIIGANSIVSENIPDKCIAIGNPAKVIKKWDDTTGQWVTVP